jgi:hypothetical protein
MMLGQLDECAYLDLTGISEPGRNSLRLVVEELQVGFQSAAQKIEHTESCRVFEITWLTYISYGVICESYARVKDYEIYEGRLARVYSRSDFLDNIRRDTFADEKYPGPFKTHRLSVYAPHRQCCFCVRAAGAFGKGWSTACAISLCARAALHTAARGR